MVSKHKVNSQRAALLPEVSISLLVFFSIIFLLIDTLLMAYRYASLQYVLSASLRDIVVKEETIASEKGAIIDVGRKFGLNISSTNIIMHADGNPANLVATPCNAVNESNGGAEEFVSLCIKYPTKYLYGLMTFDLTVIAYAKNENYNI